MSPLRSTSTSRAALLAVVTLGLAACVSNPPAPSVDSGTAVPSSEPAPDATQAAIPIAAADDQATPAPVSPTAPAIELPARAVADFDRAVSLMRAGNTVEAELELKQLIAAHPQLAAPHVNLALLHRKAGRLAEAEAELESAVERNPASAVAWNELGLTRRMRGEFAEAALAYERAITADDRFAPAHRNFGVLLDLYLGDPERALTELERYKELTGEEKPISGWIAELRQRTGKPPAPRQEEPAPAPAEPASSEPPPAEGSPPAAAPAQSNPAAQSLAPPGAST